MMKYIIGLVVVLWSNMTLSAQELSRMVTGSAGGIFQIEGMSLSVTVGQSGLVGNFRRSDLQIHAGFQQSLAPGTTRMYLLDSDLGLEVFPNPFTESLVLSWQSKAPRHVDFKLFDMEGHLLVSRDGSTTSLSRTREVLSLGYLPQGAYELIVVVHGVDGRITRYHKTVVKV